MGHNVVFLQRAGTSYTSVAPQGEVKIAIITTLQGLKGVILSVLKTIFRDRYLCIKWHDFCTNNTLSNRLRRTECGDDLKPYRRRRGRKMEEVKLEEVKLENDEAETE